MGAKEERKKDAEQKDGHIYEHEEEEEEEAQDHHHPLR